MVSIFFLWLNHCFITVILHSLPLCFLSWSCVMLATCSQGRSSIKDIDRCWQDWVLVSSPWPLCPKHKARMAQDVTESIHTHMINYQPRQLFLIKCNWGKSQHMWSLTSPGIKKGCGCSCDLQQSGALQREVSLPSVFGRETLTGADRLPERSLCCTRFPAEDGLPWK